MSNPRIERRLLMFLRENLRGVSVKRLTRKGMLLSLEDKSSKTQVLDTISKVEGVKVVPKMNSSKTFRKNGKRMAWDAGDTDYKESTRPRNRPRKGRLTHTFLSDVTKKTCSWSQGVIIFLTGHGMFAEYFNRRKICDRMPCYCGSQESGPFHLLTPCSVYEGHPLTIFYNNRNWTTELFLNHMRVSQ